MKTKFCFILLLYVLSGFFGTKSWADEDAPTCKASYAQLKNKTDVVALQKKIEEKLGKNVLYRPVLSTDKDFLRSEVLLAEGPAPQRNMKIVPGSEQFRNNPESKAIFEEKKRLMARYPEKIVGVMKGQENYVREAAIEQFNFMLEELPVKSPNVFKREGDSLVNLLTGDRTSAKELSKMSAKNAMMKLGEFVPDDLILMKKFGDEYKVVGGNLAFPTHWEIDFALGKTITEIHENIPGTPESRVAFSKMINGVLDRTLTSSDIVRRNNWFIESDPRYALPGYQKSTYASPSRITKENYRNSTFLRTERQTMRGLPNSKMVTFSICPYVFPMGTFAEDRALAKNLVDGIRVKLAPSATRGDDALKIAKYLEQDLNQDAAVFDTKVAALKPVDSVTNILSLEKPSGLELSAGEAVRVTVETPNGPQTRTLSLASAPNAQHLEFATRDSDSEFKKAFKNLTPGSKVNIELLRTSLEFKEDKPAVMIAGGIGITPFRSFIQHAKEKNLEIPMWLFYGNRSEIPFKSEIDAAAGANQKLKVEHVLSRPNETWQGNKGRVDKAFLSNQVPSLPKDSVYYIVGSPQMAEDTQKALRELGVPEEQIKSEIFPDASGSKGNAPIDARTAQACDTVCFCQKVNAGTIRDAISNGAKTLDDIKIATKAATGCGGCAKNVMGFLECAGSSK